MQLEPRELAVLALGVVILTLLAASALGRWWRGARARRRTNRARRGESRAEKLLERRGYRVEARQAPTTFTFLVDGDPQAVELRADLIVRRRGRRYLAEVKTGTRAPRPEHRATRRQLLEYSLAFDVDGLLLVDPGRGTIREITFPW